MDKNDAILEHWIKQTTVACPRLAAALTTPDPDAFRNPVGFTLRQSMSRLLVATLSGADEADLDSALDQLMHIQAVLVTGGDDAVRFLCLLSVILQEFAPDLDPAVREARIRRLTQLAIEKYLQCRERIVQIRAHERARAIYWRARSGAIMQI